MTNQPTTHELSPFTNTTKYLSEIKQSNLLNPELEQVVQSMLPELQHNFETQTIWRTETEIRLSVLNNKDFPDAAAKYHQAKVEQGVFFDQLLQLSFEYRKQLEKVSIKEADIEEFEYKIGIAQESFEEKRLVAQRNIAKIELEELLCALQTAEKQGEERVRELEIWSRVKHELEAADPHFDKDNKDTQQLVSMTRSYIQKMYHAEQMNGSDSSSYSNIKAHFETLINACIQQKILADVLGYFGKDHYLTTWVLQKIDPNFKQEKDDEK